jgi:hypothetical protein
MPICNVCVCMCMCIKHTHTHTHTTYHIFPTHATYNFSVPISHTNNNNNKKNTCSSCACVFGSSLGHSFSCRERTTPNCVKLHTKKTHTQGKKAIEELPLIYIYIYTSESRAIATAIRYSTSPETHTNNTNPKMPYMWCVCVCDIHTQVVRSIKKRERERDG